MNPEPLVQLHPVWLLALCLALGAAGAWLVACHALTLGLMDRPNERSSHRQPTPKGGGIGLLAAWIAAGLWLGLPLLFWLPPAGLAVLSLVGDRREISPKVRLAAQFLLACLALLAVLPWQGMSSLVLMAVLAVFVTGTANFYNFMDGINGIAGLTGLVAFGFLAWFAARHGCLCHPPAAALLCAGLALACAGFLPFNLPRARTFMGDVGSVLLGFVFALMAVALAADVADFLCLTLLLFPFYADELTTMWLRLRAGENLLQAHRRHLYQVLVNEGGIAHWIVAAGFGILQIAVALLALWVRPLGALAEAGLWLLLLVLFTLAGARLRSMTRNGMNRPYVSAIG